MIAMRPSFSSVLILALTMLVCAGCTKGARKDRCLARGDRDFGAESYDEAEIEYRKALQLAPFDPTAVRQLGYLYFNEGRLPLAYVYLRKAAELRPEDNDVRVKLGMCELPLGLVKEAREAARRVLQSQPETKDALLLLADSSRKSNEAEDARQLIEKLRQQGKDRSGYHLAVGSLRMAQRDTDGAEKEFTRALELDPKSSDAYAGLGEVYWNRHDLKKADQALKSAADNAPLRSTRRLRYAEFKAETGAASEARKILDEMTGKAPDYIPAWVLAMRLAFDERRYDDCDAAIKRILARDNGNYEALLQRGNLKLARGDAAGAVEELEHLDRAYGRVAQLKYRLALAYLRKGDNAKAENSLYQAIQIAPDYDAAQLLMAELNLRKGNPIAAVDTLAQIIKARPQVERAYLLLARAYLAEKSPDRALAVYHRLEEVAPKDPQVPFLIGMLQVSERHPADARKAFEQSVAINPDYARSLEMLVNLDLAEMGYSAATDRVQGLIKRYPKAPAPWVLMEKIHLAERNLNGAESDLLKAIDLDPKYQIAYLLLARVYVATNKQQQALDKLTALADKTNNANALLQIGLIHQELKQFDAARSAYERLLAADPRNVPALDNLARVYSENLGQSDKALEIAKRAQELQPDNARTADTLGWVLYKRGDYHAALAHLLEAAEKEPADPEVRFHVGMAHYMLGEEGPARLALQQTIAAGPESPDKEEARRRLGFLDIEPATADPKVQSDLETRVRTEPNDPVARLRLAAIQARKGGAGDAAASYEAALKLSPRDVTVMLDLVRLYSGPLHDPARARELAKNAHEIAPNDSQISHTLGRLLYETGDYGWSLDLLRQAAREIHGEPELMYDLARSYYSAGKVSEAEETLKDASQGAVSPALSSNAGRLASMIAAGKSPALAQAALPEAQKILEANPDDVPAGMVLALARESQGNIPEARRLYERILAADALFAPAARRLALLYAQRLDDDQKAYDLAAKARGSFPDDPELAKVLGIIDYRKADYAGAAHLLQESLHLRGDDPETLFYLGMSHYRLKELTESRAELQRALDLNVADQEANEAKRALDDMNEASHGPSLSDVPIR
jgi:tetratricopeptide (TPR) repeat protein